MVGTHSDTKPAFDPKAVAMKALTGNWIGAAVVALATLGAALLLSLVYVVTQLEDPWSIGAILGNGFAVMFAALGVPLDFTTESAQVTGSMWSVPLLITFLAASAGVLTFTRVVRGYPSKAAALGDAVRSGLVLAVLTTVAMIVVRIVNPSVREMAAEWDYYAMGAPLHQVIGGEAVPSIAGAILIPGIALALLLSAAVLRGSLPSVNRIVTAVADVATPAVQGIRTLLWCTLPAGLVLATAKLTTPEADTNFALVVREFFGLPNWGVSTIGAGLGAPFGLRGTDRPDEVGHLGTLAEDFNWVVWLAIPVAIAVVVLTAYVAVRAAARTQPLPGVAAYLVGLLVALPVLGFIANLTLGFQYVGADNAEKLRLGVDLTELTFIYWGASILACLGALLLMGKLTVARLQSRPDEPGPAPVEGGNVGAP